MPPQTFRINKIHDLIKLFEVMKLENEKQAEAYKQYELTHTAHLHRASAYEMCIETIREEFGLTAE